MVVQGKEAASLVTVLGVFVAATFRMIPSLNRIIAAIQNIKYYETSVNVVYSEIKSYSETQAQEPTEKEVLFTQSIALENLTFSFKEGKDLLKDAYLYINKGQTVGIIGASGAGKSTLIDLIIGLQAPNSGTIKIDGLPGLQMSTAWRKQIGYVSQTIYLTDNSIQNNIAFGIPETAIDQQKIETILEQVQLTSFVNALTEGVHTKVGERGVQLSGGQRQRIGIARALYNNPSVLVLDEATSALDLETEKEVMKAINALKGQKTIIMIAHRMATLANADVIYEVKEGKILKV
jgi:ABC-type bacteriocin/lantibiotic exporter with double-glycine peptidase domain